MCCGGDSTPPAPTPVAESEQEKALAESALSQWNRYKEVLAPFEDKMLKSIETTPGEQRKVEGHTAVGTSGQFGAAERGVEQKLFAGGINPNSGKFQSAVGGLTASRGATVGSATGRASQAADDLTIQNLENAVKVGRGEAVTATRGLSDLARDASAEAQNTAALQNRYNLGKSAADQAASESIKSSVITAAGMGLSGLNKPTDVSKFSEGDWLNEYYGTR